MQLDHVTPQVAQARAHIGECQRMTDAALDAHVRMLSMRMRRAGAASVEAKRREMFDGGPAVETTPERAAYSHAFHTYQDALAVRNARRAHQSSAR